MNEQPRIREGFVENTDVPEERQEPVKAKPNGPAAPIVDEELDAPVVDTWPLRVKLMKSIHISGTGDIVNELTFREPTGRDIYRHGNPTRMGPDMMFVIDEKKMMLMMTALSGIMTPDLERMDARDWNTCAWRLYRFFLPSTILD